MLCFLFIAHFMSCMLYGVEVTDICFDDKKIKNTTARRKQFIPDLPHRI